ncbi:MAG: alpha/beta hydrolase [Bacteroidetes bacterium]|nr:alpha/beta hydrolase [Bacteroidota bacterium]MBI3481510.1 alpha/beta hydrolase [Bacteroidota bacterium]
MSALTRIAFLLIIFLCGCSPKNKKEDNHEAHIKFIQYSESVKDTFYIDIQLPAAYFKNPDKKYPTAYLVDGNFYFPMMSAIKEQYEFTGLMKSVILVGIGYKSFQMMDSLRVRDYLYPRALPSDEVITDGGAQKFLDFITQELIPKVDAEYRTEKDNKALLGHSFGGYFVLYSLLHQLQNKRNDFRTFISASPSLWYNNFYLNQLPDLLGKNQQDLNVFVSVGGKEDPVWSVKPVTDLSDKVQEKRIKGLQFQSRVYNHLNHMDVAVLAFTMGLQGFMGEGK